MWITNWFRSRGQVVVIYLLGLVILINAGVIIYLKNGLVESERTAVISTALKEKAITFFSQASMLDLKARDFRLQQHSGTASDYQNVLTEARKQYDTILSFLEKNAYNKAVIDRFTADAGEALKVHQTFLSAINQGDSASIAEQYNKLPVLNTSVNSFINDLAKANQTGSHDSLASLANISITLQVLMVISIPFLIFVGRRIKTQRNYLLKLNQEIEESNRKFVFNPLDEVDYTNGAEIKTRLLSNLKKAAHFIQQIADGNYDIRWEGLNDSNKEVNKDNIAGELIRMRGQMKNVKEQDRIRIWSTEGLSRFGDIIRKHQDNFEALSDQLISNVVRYVDAKVGGLFILEESAEGEKFLMLKACYAYERKKFLDKKVLLGSGLVGQAYLEGQTIYLKKVPQNYMSITSGLGDTNPGSILVVPLKTNDRIEGVLELASLRPFEPYEIEFIEKLGEMLASSVVSVRTAERTKMLLQTSQEQSEEMRAQEEEMRQNMEELEATQEQMHRQVNELNTLKESLEKEKYLFGALMDNIPDSIYFKDRDCKLIRMSKYMVSHFGVPMEELLGKSDFDFQDEVHAREAFDDEQQIMKTLVPKIDYVEKEIKADGSESWVSTTKMPLVNAAGEVVGTFGISRNVSKLKRLEMDVLRKDEQLKQEEKVYEERIRYLEEQLKAKEQQLAKLVKK